MHYLTRYRLRLWRGTFTEGFEEISDAACQYDPTIEDDLGDADWVRDNLVGIEKDYRLARVSKVSFYAGAQGRATWSSATDLKIIPTRESTAGPTGDASTFLSPIPVLCRGLQTASQASQQRTQSAGNHQR